MSRNVSQETMNQLVDTLLEYSGTPRRHLFEYPYRDDESRELIAKATRTARKMIATLEDGTENSK